MANINGSGLGILSFLVILMSLSEVLVDAKNSTMYEFGEDCFTRHEGLTEDTKIYVRYDGKPVATSSDCKYFSFELDEDTRGSYKMCVKPLNFTDPDCDVQLEIQSSYSGSSVHTIACDTEINDDFCVAENKDLYIFYKKHGVPAPSNARFLLQVYVKEEDNSAILWIIIGSLLGAIVFFSACACVIFRRICKRKPGQGIVLNSGQPNAGSAMNQPAFPYASHSTQAGNPVTNLYPKQYSSGNNPQPQYQHQFQPQPQPALYEEPEKVPSSPPPSYDQVN